MFSNINKPAFGGVTSAPSFGFGNTATTNQTPFGQTQLFGKSNTAPGFGASAPLFGAPAPQSTAALFSSASVPSFTAAPQTGFGTSLFSQQQNAGAGNTLFTNTNAASFGQQTKAAGFTFGASTTTPLFGQQQQAQNYQASTSFGAAASNFGGATQMGTTIKFNPVTGTDTMQKSGITHSISTKHHCITCMKEYESKSLEELRWEDYQCNRKAGPQQQTSFGGASFGPPPATAPSLFGQTENKPAFGQQTTFNPGGSGGTGFSLTNQPTQQSLFGKSTASFGGAPTANTFGFSTTTPGFGANTGAKPFTTPSAQTNFGAPSTQASGFGTTFFGQPNAQAASSFFNKSAQPAFSTQQQPLFTFGQPTTAQSNLFQPAKATAGFPSFGQTNLTSTSSFGQQSLFSQPPQNPFNSFQKPAQSTFGQPLQTGFTMGTPAANNSFFGGGNKPLFGTTQQNNFFAPATGGFMMPQQQMPAQNLTTAIDLQQGIDYNAMLDQVYDPFPYRNFLDEVATKTYMSNEATNPEVLKEILDRASTNPFSPAESLPRYKTSMVKPHNPTKFAMLDNSSAEDSMQNNLLLRHSNGKRLILCRKPPRNEKNMLEEYKSMSSVEGNRSLFKKAVLETSTDDQFVGAGRDANEINLAIAKVAKSLPTKTVRFQDSESESQKCDSTNSEQSKSFEAADVPSGSDDDLNLDSSGLPRSTNLNLIIPYPCGIIQTRPEYYTVPALNEMHKYKTESGACLVKGFTVGRITYGNIYFPDQINIANLNLDEIIHFRYCEITIYPDDTKKPAIGHGLNRPAQVTLEKVWPRNMDGGPKDANEKVDPSFVEKLRRSAKLQKAHFVDYRPETGSWVFNVDHFSKYRFTEDEDEEATKALAQEKLEHEKKVELEKKLEEEKKLQDIKKKLSERSAPVDPTVDDLGETVNIGLGGIPYQDIGASTSADALHRHASISAGLGFKDTATCQMIKKTFFDDESMSDDISSSDVGIVHHFSVPSINTTVPLHCQLPGGLGNMKKPPPQVFTLVNRTGVVPIERSLLPSRNYMDMALFKGRSFKVGWANGFNMMTLATPIGPIPVAFPETNPLSGNTVHNINEQPNTVYRPKSIVHLGLGELASRPRLMYIEQHLEAVFQESQVSVDASGIPLFTINPTPNALIRHHCIAQILEKENKWYTSYYKQVWSLCLALWGPNATTPTQQRNLFSTWLEEAAAPYLITELDSDGCNPIPSFKNIFVYLTGRRVATAADTAMSVNLPRLSAIIATAGAHENSSYLIFNQIEQWKRLNALENLEIEVLKVYMMLGGVPVINNINVCEGLDWRRALGIHLWYMSPPGTSLIHGIQLYIRAYETYAYAIRPAPLHYQDTPVMVHDVMYHLMMLYASTRTCVDNTINPNTYTDDPLDYRLSWLLLQVLTALDIGAVTEKVANATHVNFSSQLEQLGLWKWSIFVLLFIKDNSVKKNAIMGILDRNLDLDRTREENIAVEDSLVNDFKIPSAWIHTVLANKTRMLDYPVATYLHLILAKRWSKAHKIAMKHLIPELISTEQCEKLAELLQRLAPGQESISHWDTHAGLVLEFLKFHKKIMTNREEITEFDLQQLKGEVTTLCCRLNYFPADTLKQIVAVSELSKFVAAILRILFCEVRPATIPGITAAAQLLVELRMPSDYKLDELYKYLIEYMKLL